MAKTLEKLKAERKKRQEEGTNLPSFAVRNEDDNKGVYANTKSLYQVKMDRLNSYEGYQEKNGRTDLVKLKKMRKAGYFSDNYDTDGINDWYNTAQTTLKNVEDNINENAYSYAMSENSTNDAKILADLEKESDYINSYLSQNKNSDLSSLYKTYLQSIADYKQKIYDLQGASNRTNSEDDFNTAVKKDSLQKRLEEKYKNSFGKYNLILNDVNSSSSDEEKISKMAAYASDDFDGNDPYGLKGGALKQIPTVLKKPNEMNEPNPYGTLNYWKNVDEATATADRLNKVMTTDTVPSKEQIEQYNEDSEAIFNAEMSKYNNSTYDELMKAYNNTDSYKEKQWLKNKAVEIASSSDLQNEVDGLGAEYDSLYNSGTDIEKDKRRDEIEAEIDVLNSKIKDKTKEETRSKALSVINNNGEIKSVLDVLYKANNSKYTGSNSDEAVASYEQEYTSVVSDSEKADAQHKYDDLVEKGYDMDTLYQEYERSLNEQRSAAQIEQQAEYAKDNPIPATINSVIASTYLSPLDNIKSVGAAMGDGYIDTNTFYSKQARAMQSAVAETFDNPISKTLYSAGTSIAENLLLMPVTLSTGGAGKSIQFGIYGAQGASSGIADTYDNTGDIGKSIETGIAQGIAEGLFEELSLDKLRGVKSIMESGSATFGDVLKKIGTSAFVEGTEELGTSLTNTITDQIINGDMSQISLNYKNYIEQGYSEDEAWKMCAVDFGIQVGQSFAGGAISGGVLSGGAIGLNYAANKIENSKPVVNNKVGKAVKANENVNSLIETAKKLSPESKAYKVAVQLEEQQKNNKKVSSSKVGQLRSLIIEQSQSEFDTEYKKVTENLHEDEKAVVDKLLNREALSEDEVKIVNNNDVLKNNIADLQKKFNNLYSNAETADKAPFESIKSIDDNTDKIDESKLKVSEDGKTKVNDEVYDGAMEVVRTNPFAGTVTYKIEKNGKVIEVNSENIEFRTKEEAKLNALASKYNVQTAQKFLELYEKGQNVNGYSEEFNLFQNYGRLAVPLDNEKLNVGYLLDNDQKMGAYEAGLTSRKSCYQAQNIISSNAKNSKYYAYTKGNFNASAIKGIQLDETQRVFYNFFREFALRTGINVELFSSKEKSGKYQGEQGSWNKATNTIRIDINAGLMSEADRKNIKHGMLNTFSHELTHIAELSGFYDELHEAIVNALEKHGTDFNELVEKKKEQLRSDPNTKPMSDEKLTYLADVEVIADACETMLKNSKIFEDIAQGNPTLAQKLKAKLKDFIQRLKQLLDKTNALTHEGELLEECVTEFENIQKLWDKAVADGIKTANAMHAEQKNNTADNNDVRNQSRNIVQFEFEKNVDAIEKNTYNSDNVVIMGVTPDILQKIGLTPLPLAMTQNHIYSIAVSEARAKKEGRYRKNTNYHDLGFDTVKDIYDKISNPIMVIAHPDFTNKASRDSTHKVIVLVDLSINNKQVIAPISVDYKGMYNNTLIDVNLVATYFDKNNINDLIKEAVALENNNQTGFFYIDKKRTQSMFKKSGYQLPSQLINLSSNIIIRKIDDNVNKKINKITQSQQFIRWFGDWQNHPENASKVVDKNGEPLVVYHQTEKSFTAFDTKQKGSGKFDSEMPTGIFMKPTNTDIGVGGNIQMPLYANIKNPLVVNNRNQLVDFYNKNVQGYIEAKTSINDIDSEYKGKFQEEMKRENEEYQKLWIAQKNGEITEEEYQKSISRDALDDILEEWNNKVNEASLKAKSLIDNYFENSKYDGVIVNNDTGSFGRSTKTIIAFNNTQVKSATDNIGTFDGNNPDIRYQSRNTGIDEDIEELLFDEEFYKPFENEDKTVITESLSELQTKLENMNDDNSTWEEQFSTRIKIKALKEGYKSPYDYFVGKQKKNILKDYEYDPEKYKEKFKKKLEKKAKEESLKNDIANATPHKRAQYYIIQKTNPMWDDYHLGIRSPKDIKTFQEVVDEGEGFEWGDFDLDDAKKALKKGTIRVYSSYAIKNGTFVSTSYQQALGYAGMNPQNVHSRVVALDSVAWINGDEGQYAKVYKSNLDDNIQYQQRYVEPASTALEERLQGDELLDAQDIIDTIKSVGGKVDEYGNAILYHGTNKKSRDSIYQSGKMTAKEDGLFFSTKPDGEIKGYGDNIVRVKIPVEYLELNDVFNDEAHFRLPLNSDYSANVSSVLFQMRPDNGFANRRLLANALEKSAQNNYEKNKVKLYKENIDQIDELEKQLDRVNKKIKAISSVKAAERNKIQRTELMKLNNVKKILQDKIVRKDKQLLNFESMDVMKKLIESEKKKAKHEARINYEAKLKDEREKHNAELASVKERDRERIAEVRESKDKIIVAEREKRKTMVKGVREARDNGP